MADEGQLKAASGAKVFVLVNKARGKRTKRKASAGGSSSARGGKRQASKPSSSPPLRPEPPLTPVSADGTFKINRSPVMILWAAALAERAEYSWPEALSLGSAVAGMIAQAKASSPV